MLSKSLLIIGGIAIVAQASAAWAQAAATQKSVEPWVDENTLIELTPEVKNIDPYHVRSDLYSGILFLDAQILGRARSLNGPGQPSGMAVPEGAAKSAKLQARVNRVLADTAAISNRFGTRIEEDCGTVDIGVVETNGPIFGDIENTVVLEDVTIIQDTNCER